MSLRAVSLFVVVALFALFTVLNWGAFMAPTSLSIVFTTVQAPLGLVVLVFTALLAALFLAYLVYIQTAVILEARRTARELAVQRQLADQAEASRFTELRNSLDVRLQALDSAIAEARVGTGTRLDRLDGDLRSTIESAANTLAAYIGEVEDRLEQRMGDHGARPAA